MGRKVKGEPSSSTGGSRIRKNSRPESAEPAATTDSGRDDVLQRRVLRSRYLAVKNRINDQKEELSSEHSDKFKAIFEEVESLHQQVEKPREQVADAEALLDITNTLVTSVKAHGNDGITPSAFVTCLLRDFGQLDAALDLNSIRWTEIGLVVSHIFNKGFGCSTMLGPMNTELKQRKMAVRRKRARRTDTTKPDELDDSVKETRTDTDINMSTMFEILRKNRIVKLENLILNKKSFAQTVENLFALSFLVKDGRAEIKVDEKGCHLVSPKNAPAANAVTSREVCYNHFVFRFDFKDWKLMLASVGDGEELMPHRDNVNILSNSQTDPMAEETQEQGPTTPIRKFSRNRGLVLQEQTVVEGSPESNDSALQQEEPLQLGWGWGREKSDKILAPPGSKSL